MNKFLLFLAIFSISIFAQDSIVTIVGPGTRFIHVTKPEIPWNITMLEVDLTNPFINIETEIANNQLGNGLEKPTSMSLRNDQTGHRVLGAVNGDYFGISAPNNPYTFLSNSQIKDGEFIFGRTHQRSSFGSIGKNPVLEIIDFSGKIWADNNQANSIFGVNRERGNNQLILYNKFIGTNTLTNEQGTEIRVKIISDRNVNDSLICEVIEKESNIGAMPIGNDYVLSGNGNAALYLENNFSVGDTVKLLMGTNPNLGKLTALVGGGPRMIIDGTRPESFDGFEGFGGTHTESRHPRSAVGFNADTTKLYLLVVDGRNPNLSLGMTISELSNYMISIGCANAINLDGGGSSSLVVRNEVKNTPSDATGERSVGNALLVVSTAPIGSLEELHIFPEQLRIFMGKTQQITVQGTDEYLNPLTLNPDSIEYQISKPTLGAISQSGLFTAGINNDSGYIIINYGNVSDSIFVAVKTINRLDLQPDLVVTDKSRLVNFTAHVYDTDNEEQSVSANNISWRSTDTTIGTVDVLGQFHGRNEGTTYVVAEYLQKKDSSIVNVEISYGSLISDSIESIDNWSLSGENIDTINTQLSLSDQFSSIGNNSLQLDYQFTYHTGSFNWAYLNTNIPIPGVPDSLTIDILSDGANHRIFFDVMDANGIMYRISVFGLANQAGSFKTLKGRVTSSTGVVFPLTLKRIAIPLGSGQVDEEEYTGTIYIDNFGVRYPNAPTSINDELQPEGYALYQNYPNPFNPETKIRFQIPQTEKVILNVYDLLGREIVELVNGELSAGIHEYNFNASGLASGIYFYKINSGNFSEEKKLVLIK